MAADEQVALRRERLERCYECGRRFSYPVSEARAAAEWGDASADEIAYLCGSCVAPEDQWAS